MKTFIDQLIVAGIEESEAKKEISMLLSEFGENNSEKIKSIVHERIKTRTPIQYLIGKAYFMDFEVKVNNKVLIPRPETEILVEKMVCRGVARNASTALDIGTGSGIIPIALARLMPDIKITAIDIDKEIIDLASENAKLNKVEKKIDFKVCDLFSNSFEELLKNQKFDLIISNPPYIKENISEKQPEVTHEPVIALHGSKENKSGLIYYERIFELVKKCQSIKLLAFEIDPSLVNNLKSLLKKENLNNFEIVKDYSGLERCLFVYIPFVG